MVALLAGAATVAGVLIALAAPATAIARGGAAVAQDCGGGFKGGGDLYCGLGTASNSSQLQPACGGVGLGAGNVISCDGSATTPVRVISATAQDCGPFSGSGGRTCEESTTATLTAASVADDCDGPYGGSGGRTCEESTTANLTAASVADDCDGPLSGSGGRTCDDSVAPARSTAAG